MEKRESTDRPPETVSCPTVRPSRRRVATRKNIEATRGQAAATVRFERFASHAWETNRPPEDCSAARIRGRVGARYSGGTGVSLDGGNYKRTLSTTKAFGIATGMMGPDLSIVSFLKKYAMIRTCFILLLQLDSIQARYARKTRENMCDTLRGFLLAWRLR